MGQTIMIIDEDTFLLLDKDAYDSAIKDMPYFDD